MLAVVDGVAGVAALAVLLDERVVDGELDDELEAELERLPEVALAVVEADVAFAADRAAMLAPRARKAQTLNAPAATRERAAAWRLGP